MERDNILDIEQQKSGTNTPTRCEAKDNLSKDSLKKDKKYTQFNITLLEERPLFREALAQLLTTLEPKWHVTSYSDERMLMARGQYNDATPSLIIIGIDNSLCCDMADVEQKIRSKHIDVPVLILMDVEDVELASEYLELGAKGIITPFLEPTIITKAISLIFAGGTYVPPFFITGCINVIQKQNNRECNSESHSIRGEFESSGWSKDSFTPRQWDVLNLICQGLPNKIIARNLNMQECSVKAHVRQLMKKLGVQNRTQIACRGANIVEL